MVPQPFKVESRQVCSVSFSQSALSDLTLGLPTLHAHRLDTDGASLSYGRIHTSEQD
ncbi:hypothetical protein DPMN_068402 [Dreissena polymorpha]|uniref:Uncharacterized protein n=1 Tax=Dreissena polymorpha TaxID=45954 RepID=A0A9D3Z2G6_DREPO|nr:hypothetical protein DPMN_068402 [Dreissena polymorpha]